MSRVEDQVTTPLEKYGITTVCVIDDDYIPLEDLEVGEEDAAKLWAAIEDNSNALDELKALDSTVVGPELITGAFASKLRTQRSQYPALDEIWRNSSLGVALDNLTALLDPITDFLESRLRLKVQKLTPTDEISDTSVNIFFLDWHLDDSVAGDVIAPAVSKAKEIYAAYEANNVPKPLVVLMSSRPGVLEEQEDFRRRSGLLAGMFYAIHKQDMRDPFRLGMHLQMYAMSLPVGHPVQRFVDMVCTKVDEVGPRFVEHIKELTLSDYAFIHALSLKEEGEPLGNYMFWLFGAYFGYLLFDVALHDIRDAMNNVTFDHSLPIHATPSLKLAEVYHHALFDTEVGEVGPHPHVSLSDIQAGNWDPYISLGDVFVLESVKSANPPQSEPVDTEAATEAAPVQSEPVETADRLSDNDRPSNANDGAGRLPKLYMIINNECDLTFTPYGKRKIKDDQAVLLIEGTLQSVIHYAKQVPRTELFIYEDQPFKIVWELKKVVAVPYSSFRRWCDEQNLKRKARLRLPFALEVQRSFAADLTRIGLPVAPALYRPATFEVLQSNGANLEKVNLDGLESAGIVSTRDRSKFKLTLPLVTKIRDIMIARVAGGKDKDRAQTIESLISDIAMWSDLWISDHELPEQGKLRSLLTPEWALKLGLNATQEELAKHRMLICINIEPTAS
jgi:hypothetical protein